MRLFQLRSPIVGALLLAIAAVIATLIISMVPSCRDSTSTATKQSQQAQLRQADHGDAILKAAATQLSDLPSAVNTQLRPPVVILDSRSSADNKDVLAVCAANPSGPANLFNVIHVPAGNGRFRGLGVKSGDILKYYVLEDQTVDEDSRAAGFSRQLAMDLNVAQVIDDNTLLLENPLNQAVDQPRKIEVWRHVDDRLEDIQEKFRIYEVYRRPALGWEPAPDEQVITQVVAWLRQWIRQSDPKTDWKQEPLLDTLDAKLRKDAELAPYLAPEKLAAQTFPPEDGRQIQETIWLRDISRWAPTERFDDVSRATALFDWTVRNIQLVADDAAAPHRPWQTLLYGRGTAEQRAWVFALLARQQGLDVVILSLPTATPADEKAVAKSGAAKFWLPAFFAEGQLYLFDTRLGLPIPGPGGKGVATLEQVRNDDALLRQLDIEGTSYPIKAESLKSVEINMVADPFTLSRRASQVEANLSGDDRVVLAAKPSELAGRLKSISGVSAIRLWDFPFETVRKQLSLVKSARESEALEFEPFAKRPALWKDRTRHFQGKRKEPTASGGKTNGEPVDDRLAEDPIYMSKAVRPTAKEIAQATSEGKRRVDSTAKINATYWVGLLAFDEGKVAVAESWLRRPQLTAAGSPWSFGANYNLARALESQGKFDAAITILEKDTSPQQHGNKLRARALKAKAAETKKGE